MRAAVFLMIEEVVQLTEYVNFPVYSLLYFIHLKSLVRLKSMWPAMRAVGCTLPAGAVPGGGGSGVSGAGRTGQAALDSSV